MTLLCIDRRGLTIRPVASTVTALPRFVTKSPARCPPHVPTQQERQSVAAQQACRTNIALWRSDWLAPSPCPLPVHPPLSPPPPVGRTLGSYTFFVLMTFLFQLNFSFYFFLVFGSTYFCFLLPTMVVSVCGLCLCVSVLVCLRLSLVIFRCRIAAQSWTNPHEGSLPHGHADRS